MALIRFYELDYPFFYGFLRREERQHSTSEGEDETQSPKEEEQFEQTQRLSDSTLKGLVKDQRLVTLQVLADHLLMDFSAIRSHMSRETWNVPSATGKRIVGSERDDRASQEDKKPKLVAQTNVTDSFFRELIRDPDEVRKSSEKSSDGHVTWNHGTWPLPRRLKRNTPSEASERASGSTEVLSSNSRLSASRKRDESEHREGSPSGAA